MIDLHLHTNASDGLYGPDELMRRARDAGLRIVSVTDHDTMAGVPGAMGAAADYGLRCVAGIEITAVLDSRDVHVLGYFLDPASGQLRDFLVSLRADRIRRARQMAERLASLGCPIDIDAVLQHVAADPGRAIARPRLAVELLRAGHVDSLAEALECVRRESLSVAETGEVVDLLLASSTREQKEFVLEKPRQALAQARGGPSRCWDPRLSTAGNRVARKLAWLLANLAGMENWLRHRGRGELSLCDGTVLSPGLERLAQDGGIVAELAKDLVAEMKLP